jgi:hypothetical protein
MDLFKPRGASKPRNPTDNNQKHGVMINTPRYSQFGGLSNASKTAFQGLKLEKPGDGKKII